MFLGYQQGKIKFYVEQPLNSTMYNVDRWEETQDEYVLDGNEYVIKDEAWEEEQKRKERERINALNLTKADFWIALLDRDITKAMVKAKIELIPDETLKAKTLIRLDEADHFWRGDPSMDIIGAMFGITPADLDYLFENKALPVVDEVEE
jgi:hypothetical protein